MGTIAHVLEMAGLATVMLASVRDHAERLRPPRALYCEFPLGRPLGVPGDAVFQRRVLSSAFDLLERPEGPVLEDFPESISDGSSEAIICQLPPRLNASLPAAIDEAQGLAPAYRRNLEATGRTLVGRAVSAEDIPKAIAAFLAVIGGRQWKEVGLPGHPLQWSRDITSYYEEAAVALSDHVPAARAAETWFYHHTETGKILLEARQVMKQAGEPFWFYLVPFTQDPQVDEPSHQ